MTELYIRKIKRWTFFGTQCSFGRNWHYNIIYGNIRRGYCVRTSALLELCHMVETRPLLYLLLFPVHKSSQIFMPSTEVHKDLSRLSSDYFISGNKFYLYKYVCRLILKQKSHKLPKCYRLRHQTNIFKMYKSDA